MKAYEHGLSQKLFEAPVKKCNSDAVKLQRLPSDAQSPDTSCPAYRPALDIWLTSETDTVLLRHNCCCSAIPSALTAGGKCPHYGECDIDAARASKTSGTQQLTGGIHDDGADQRQLFLPL